MANATSTQSHLKIASIEEGVLILHNGSLAVVLKVLPINFDLKNDLEQNAIIAKFQGFLNSLDYPLQIVVRSKRLDLEPYLDELENHTKQITNELLQIQADDYINFMRSLVEVANIMSKEYYVVISYHRTTVKNPSGFMSLFQHQGTPKISRAEFDRFRGELNSRANTIANGLSQLGLNITALDTQQLIELFYSLYNPDLSSTERLVDIENIKAGVVSQADDTIQFTEPAKQPPTRSDRIDIQPGDNDIAAVVGAAPAPEAPSENPTPAPEQPEQTDQTNQPPTNTQ